MTEENTHTEQTMNTPTPLTFRCTGDGYWGSAHGILPPPNLEVTLDSFTLDPHNHVTVFHNGPWWVYTDSGFRDAARKFTGIADLDFTEQGMQAHGEASMEYSVLSYAS